MTDMFEITRGLYMDAALDDDGYLEVNTGADDDFSYGWMSRREIVDLIAHLQRLLEDADEKQETER